MNLYNMGTRENSTRSIKMLQTSLFTLAMVLILFLSGCGGGGSGSSNGPSGYKPANLPIESIVLVSPTESGSIDLVTGYPQKILVAGIDKKGTRKILSTKDGLTFTIKDPNFATITESGIISAKSSAIGESTSLNIKLNKNISLNNIPVLKHTATLESNIIIYANESSVSPINLPQNFHVKLGATGTFDDGKTRDISAYTGLWSSSDKNIAFESDSIFGITLFSKNAGPTTIHAIGGINVESDISIIVYNAQLNSMSISPNNTIIPFESKLPMKAIGNFTYDVGSFDIDMTNNVTWSVESSVIANINDTTGILTTHESSGNIKVNAVSKLGKSATANLTIGNAIIESIFISTQESGLYQTESITLNLNDSTRIYPFGTYSDGKIYRLDKSTSPECIWYIGDPQGFITLQSFDIYAILTAKRSGTTSIILQCSPSLKYTTIVYVNP